MLRLFISALVCATLAFTATAGFYEKGAGVINLNSKNFDKLVLDSNDVWIVEFYAPWCGHCKNMIPEYKKAGKALSGHVKLGAVDATASSELGQKYGVQGYPTIKVFGKDKTKPTEYEGGRKATDFIVAARKALKEATGKEIPKLKEEESASGSGGAGGMYDGQSDVIQLTADNFEKEVLQSDEAVIVEFYAPWCGHCKNMAGDYKKAAKALKGHAKLAALDATAHGSVSSKYNVQGFPTIKIFGKDKSNPTEFEGGRKTADFISAARKAVVAMGKEAFPKLDEETASSGGSGGGGSSFYEGSEVVELTDDAFEKEVLNGDSAWLVEFYAPWCGHCKNLAPEFKKAAAELGGAVRLAAIDATVHSKYSNEYKVEGFPTIKFFAPKSAGKEPEDYNSARNAEGIVKYCLAKAELYPGKPVEVLQIKDTDALTALAEKKSTIGVFIVPHVMDTGAEGRNKMLETFSRVASKARGKSISFGWIVGGEHPTFEEAFGIYTNYPAFVVLNTKKLRYATLKGSFTEDNIAKMITNVFSGKLSTTTIATMPKLSKNVPLWDGKDYVPTEDDE